MILRALPSNKEIQKKERKKEHLKKSQLQKNRTIISIPHHRLHTFTFFFILTHELLEQCDNNINSVHSNSK